MVSLSLNGREVCRPRGGRAPRPQTQILTSTPSTAKPRPSVGHAIGPPGQYGGYLAIIDLPSGATEIISTAPFEGQSVAWDPQRLNLGSRLRTHRRRKVTRRSPHAILSWKGLNSPPRRPKSASCPPAANLGSNSPPRANYWAVGRSPYRTDLLPSKCTARNQS